MFWLDRIPPHAAVDESVQLAKTAGYGAQSGFINAVLRAYSREIDTTRIALDDLKRHTPHLGFSHPEWLCQRWESQWGRDALVRLLEFNNTPPPTFARVNTLKTDPDSLARRWESEGVRIHTRSWDWTANIPLFELESHPALATLPSFQEGLYYIQDPSTLLAVAQLDPQPHDDILDLCAAPGGKTTLIAQLTQNRSPIVAYDTSPARLELVLHNCRRLGVSSVQAISDPNNLPPGRTFDRILIDAPCSNSGVIRRRVDLRWRIRPGELDRLRSAQLDLLESTLIRLKRGSILVYSTCSLEPEENSMVVREFLSRHPGFVLQHERELRPFITGTDGAYVATLKSPETL
jgi:16S rRNA (cytosine967-C5)-methyltransferase